MTDQKYALVLHRDCIAANLVGTVVRRYGIITDGELDHITSKDGFKEVVAAIYLEIERRVPAHSRNGARLAVIRGLLPYARDGEELASLGGQAPSPDQLNLTPRMTRMGNVYDAPSFTVKSEE